MFSVFFHFSFVKFLNNFISYRLHISDFLDAAGFAEMRRRLFGIEVLFVLVLVMKDFNFKLSLVIFLFNFFYFVYQNVSAFGCAFR